MATRVLLAVGDILNFKTARRVAGDIIINNTSWTDVGVADLVVPAEVGDVVEVGANFLLMDEAVTVRFDVATIVAGSPVSYFSSTTGTPADSGLAAWWSPGGSYVRHGMPDWLTLVSGDLSSGTVTLRLRFKSDGAANRTIKAASDFPFMWSAKNLGPPAA